MSTKRIQVPHVTVDNAELQHFIDALVHNYEVDQGQLGEVEKQLTAQDVTDLHNSLIADEPETRPLTSGTPISTTSGTEHDFTSIPSWVKKITIMLSGVSTNGISPLAMQLGDSGGIEATGYTGQCIRQSAGTNEEIAHSTFFYITEIFIATLNAESKIELSLIDSSTNTWIVSGITTGNVANYPAIFSGSKSLSGTLDRIRITTAGGTDSFDAGSANILYE